MILHAREREAKNPTGTEYLVADAALLDSLADGSFDLVVAGMALMDIVDAEGALREAGRVLRAGGRFVASMIHPCFDTGEENSCWVAERYAYETRVFRKVGRYRELFEHRPRGVLAAGRRRFWRPPTITARSPGTFVP
jgi:ubiquinone/menaquinone biosynthesis C-methylase UbiE